MFLIAGTITTAAALQGTGGHKRVEVSTEPSSTTEPDTTIPETSSTVPGLCIGTPDMCSPVTTDTTPPTTVPAVTSSTEAPTTTTQPPHDPHDLSMVSVAYEGANDIPTAAFFSVPTGEERPYWYTVTNSGSWDVLFRTCNDAETVSLWSHPATQAWPPYSDGIWPTPYPDRTGAQPDVCPASETLLPAGRSFTVNITLLAGYRDAAGNIIPAPPGFTAYVAPIYGSCTQPCQPHMINSATITVDPPVWPPPPSIYSIDYKTQHMSIPSGQSADAEIVYTNGLPVTIRIPLYGPCWHVTHGNATVDCSGSRPVLTVAAHESADLHGTVWARQGFVQSGAPLAKGNYRFNMGDRNSVKLSYTPAEGTSVDVT
jgi:hypothetical protein